MKQVVFVLHEVTVSDTEKTLQWVATTNEPLKADEALALLDGCLSFSKTIVQSMGKFFGTKKVSDT